MGPHLMSINDFFEIFGDPLIQLIMVFIAGIALIVSIISLWLQLAKKSLQIFIKEYQRLVHPLLKGDDGGISVTYKGKKKSDLSLLSLGLANNGRVPITSQDFEGPVVISFKGESVLLKAIVARTNPDNLIALARIEKNKLILEPLLLNPGDGILVEVLIEPSSDRSPDDMKPEVYARIRGVKDIEIGSAYRRFFKIETPIIGIEIYPSTFPVLVIVISSIVIYLIYF